VKKPLKLLLCLSLLLLFQPGCSSVATDAVATVPPGIVPGIATCSGVYQPGLVPVSDLAGGTYTDPQGGVHLGGLYDTGLNTRPTEIDAVMPTVTAVSSVIGVALVGGSTIRIPGDSIVAAVARDASRNTQVKFANGGLSGKRAAEWAPSSSSIWTDFAAELSSAGIAPSQLRVVFYMDIDNAGTGTFTGEVNQLAVWIDGTITNLKAKYPSVQTVYLSSHHYIGYSGVPDIQEPIAYWNAWSVQQVVRKRAGRADPWTVVGPYLWVNGLGSDRVVGGIPGRSDGREDLCADFEQMSGSAGVHSSASGAAKIATDFMNFLHSDASARWYRK
jgi:hypothetical protein